MPTPTLFDTKKFPNIMKEHDFLPEILLPPHTKKKSETGVSFKDPCCRARQAVRNHHPFVLMMIEILTIMINMSVF